MRVDIGKRWFHASTPSLLVLLFSVFGNSSNGQENTIAVQEDSLESNTITKDTLVKATQLNKQNYGPLLETSINEQITSFILDIYANMFLKISKHHCSMDREKELQKLEIQTCFQRQMTKDCTTVGSGVSLVPKENLT